MLDFMRRNAEKIIWVVIIAFVLSLGILSFSRPRSGIKNIQRNTGNRTVRQADALATVNGVPIDVQLFSRWYISGLRNFTDPRQKDEPDPMISAYVGYVALLQTTETEKKADYAKKLKIKVSNKEIDQQIESFKQVYQLKDKAELERLLALNGMQYKTFRQELHRELLLGKLEENIKRTVSVTTQDVQNQYKQVSARHILIAYDRPGLTERSEKDKIRLAGEVAANVYDRLMKGEDFAQLAIEYSDDPGSKQHGGSLGFFGVNMMVPEFEQVAFSLEPQQISKPFRTQYGYHIVQVEGINQQEIPLDVDEKELQQTLLTQKQNNALQQLNTLLRSEYEVEILAKSMQAYDHKANGELEKALNLYHSLKSQDAQNPLAYLHTAEIYELLGQNTEALAEYEKALLVQKLNPARKTPYIHFYLANYYAKQNQNAKALEQLKLAEENVVDNLNILERISDQYTKLNSPANASRVGLKIQAITNERTAAAAPQNEDVQFVD